jgi:Protein of unknown function (DUF1566)
MLREVLLLAPIALVLGCGSLLGLEELPGESIDASAPPTDAHNSADAPDDSDAANTPDAQDSADTPETSDGPGEDGGTDLVDRHWAQWPVPPEKPDVTNYVISGGTVRDTTTGITWQQGVAEATSWTAANTACEGLTLGGSDAWRLPTRIELVSIIAYGTAESVNSLVFEPNTQQDCLCSSSAYAGEEDSYWYACDTQTRGMTMDRPCQVRCVLGELPQVVQAAEERYLVKDGVVTDVATGLAWQQTAPSHVSFEEAASTCKELALGEYDSGWRVATIRELQTLVDERSFDPAMYWQLQPPDWFELSTTTMVHNSNQVYGMHPKEGRTAPVSEVPDNHYRCVHRVE